MENYYNFGTLLFFLLHHQPFREIIQTVSANKFEIVQIEVVLCIILCITVTFEERIAQSFVASAVILSSLEKWHSASMAWLHASK